MGQHLGVTGIQKAKRGHHACGELDGNAVGEGSTPPHHISTLRNLDMAIDVERG